MFDSVLWAQSIMLYSQIDYYSFLTSLWTPRNYGFLAAIEHIWLYNTGHAGSMISADQCRSMPDQISSIDPKYISIILNVDQCWSMSINADQCLLDLHWPPWYFCLIWSLLIGIDRHWWDMVILMLLKTSRGSTIQGHLITDCKICIEMSLYSAPSLGFQRHQNDLSPMPINKDQIRQKYHGGQWKSRRHWSALIDIENYWSALVSMPEIWSGIDHWSSMSGYIVTYLKLAHTFGAWSWFTLSND